jgi:hypothetical protein
MNAWTQRKLRGDDAARGAAFCAAPRARFRSSVQRNRGGGGPPARGGPPPPPPPRGGPPPPPRQSGVRGSGPRTAARCADEATRARAHAQWNDMVTCTRHGPVVGRQRGRHVRAVEAAIPREIVELCSPPSMRSARVVRFARACGAATALTASSRSSDYGACGWRPLHTTCREGVSNC